MGAPAEVVEAERSAAAQVRDGDVVEVWDTLWPVVDLFLRCATQWRVAPMGGRMGLDYPALDWVARRHGVEIDAAVLADIQVLETAALETWAEQREREATRHKRKRGR